MAGKYRGPIAKEMLANPDAVYTSRGMAEKLGLDPVYTSDALSLLAKEQFCLSKMIHVGGTSGRHAEYRLNPDRPLLAVERYVSGTSPSPRAQRRRVYMREYNRKRAALRKGVSPEDLPQSKVFNGLPKPRPRKAGPAITITPRDDSALPPDQRPVETYEQFLARGGQPEVLPHKFDDRPETYPGRRVASSRKFTLTFAN